VKRNWQVNFNVTGEKVALEGAGESPYFENKERAKELRDELGQDRCYIAKGPDHPRLNDKGNPTTHTNGGNTGDGFRKPASQRRRERSARK
jgi:hypothetical protein